MIETTITLDRKDGSSLVIEYEWEAEGENIHADIKMSIKRTQTLGPGKLCLGSKEVVKYDEAKMTQVTPIPPRVLKKHGGTLNGILCYATNILQEYGNETTEN